jgi:hypothetical protein
MSSSPFRTFIRHCSDAGAFAGARAARPARPKRADGEDTRNAGHGNDDGQGDVLSREPPQREPQALGEHEARAAQGEGTVPQGQWCRLDEQAIDPGYPGGAEPGDHQQHQGRAEAWTGRERREGREDTERSRDDDAPLQA